MAMADLLGSCRKRWPTVGSTTMTPWHGRGAPPWNGRTALMIGHRSWSTERRSRSTSNLVRCDLRIASMIEGFSHLSPRNDEFWVHMFLVVAFSFILVSWNLHLYWIAEKVKNGCGYFIVFEIQRQVDEHPNQRWADIFTTRYGVDYLASDPQYEVRLQNIESIPLVNINLITWICLFPHLCYVWERFCELLLA